MALRATVRDAHTIDDQVTIDVTDDQGQSATFTPEELQSSSSPVSPIVVGSYSGSNMNLGSDAFRRDSWQVARAKAIEECLILSEDE